MKFDYVVKTDAMFCYCWFIRLCQFYVSTVLIYAMLNSPAALSNINTSAFAWGAVNARCSQCYGFFLRVAVSWLSSCRAGRHFWYYVWLNTFIWSLLAIYVAEEVAVCKPFSVCYFRNLWLPPIKFTISSTTTVFIQKEATCLFSLNGPSSGLSYNI